MAQELIVPPSFNVAQMDPAFAGTKVDPNSIAEGIVAAFPVLSIRGKVFRLKYRGEEKTILNSETGQPVQQLQVVIVKASPVISKIFYEHAYVENSREAPDCWSTNGITPDAAAPKKQGNFCASCPQNKWGSKTVNGKAAKACNDTKRLAVVPAHDMRNELYGGPMLLRIPPSSLGDMSNYNVLLQQYGQAYFSVITELSFDFDITHPKVAFKPITPITGANAQIVLELQDHPQVARMLSEGAEFVRSDEQAPGVQPAAQPTAPVAQQAAPAAQPSVPPTAATAPPPAAAPTPSVSFGNPVTHGGNQAQPGVTMPQPAIVPGVDPLTIPDHLRRPAGSTAGPQISPPGGFTPSGATTPPPAPQTAPAGPAAANPAVADLQAQLATLQAQLLEVTKAPRRGGRRSNPPPSPTPTAAAANVSPSEAAAAVTQPNPAGFTLGAAPVHTQGDTAAEGAGAPLPGNLDENLDQLLSK